MSSARTHLTISAALVSLTFLATVGTAQQTVVIPNGMAAAEGNSSNAFPWGRGGAGLRIQTVYDSTNFTAQNVTFPVIISRLRYRPNAATATTWVNTSYQTSTVRLSTSPNDQAALSTASFAANTGADVQVVFSGPMTWAAGSSVAPGPAPFLIDVPFSTPFFYDPNLGDLNIDTDLPIQTFSGTNLQLDVQTTGSLSARAYVSTGYPNPPLTINANHGVVVEVTYVPAAGIHAAFSATPTSGPAALNVQFTDTTYTDALGGVTGWAWDLDGDNVIDSTAQNPSFTYLVPGLYSVTLTASDPINGSSTLTRTNFINVAQYVFDAQTSGGGVGDLVIHGVPKVGVPTAATGFMFLSFTPAATVGGGPFLGILPDGTTFGILATPAAVGDILHWVNTPGLFPNVPFAVPAGTLAFLAGQTVDFVQADLTPGMLLANVSNVDRVTF